MTVKKRSTQHQEKTDIIEGDHRYLKKTLRKIHHETAHSLDATQLCREKIWLNMFSGLRTLSYFEFGATNLRILGKKSLQTQDEILNAFHIKERPGRCLNY